MSELFVPLAGAAVLAVIAGWLIFGDRLGPGEPGTELERCAELLGRTFEDLEDAGFDLEEPLPWNYVFMHREYEPLTPLVAHLRANGYELVETEEIREPENEFVENKVVLRRCERHTEHSLAARNAEMRDLASRYGIDLYDGSWVIDPALEPDAELRRCTTPTAALPPSKL